MERYLMTHSLLSAWKYALADDPHADATTQKNPLDEFMITLNRQSIPTTEAMRNGIDFENLVVSILDGSYDSQDKWYVPAHEIASAVRGGTYQYAAKRVERIGDMEFLLYGRLDFLKGGIIYDVKFSKGYDVGKFIDSTQHPMYMHIVPEATEFRYLVSNGQHVFTETYLREETPDIRPIIDNFVCWLETQGLLATYKEKWLVQGGSTASATSPSRIENSQGVAATRTGGAGLPTL